MKEQTLTAEEFLRKQGYSESMYQDEGMIQHISMKMEQYAQAKVLEALEREVIEAHTQGQAFVIKQDNLKHGRYPIASIGYYETEVKPKYEK